MFLEDAYRGGRLIPLSSPGITGTHQRAVGSAVTGTIDRREAAARALDRFAAHGVTGYRDAAGRNWHLETYAEMATRTAAGQAHLAGTLDRYRSEGRDLVIISDNAYTPGLTKPHPSTENHDGYEDWQRQRDLERRVRESRRRVAAPEELGDTSTLCRQRALLNPAATS